MDPLEKFKTDFVRARGEAYQPGEKPGEKPRPRRKQNTQAQKPTPAQNNLREFGDRLPGDELDNNPPHQTNSDPPPAISPEEYGTSNRNRSQSAEAEIDVAKVFAFLGDAPHAPPRELINGLIPAEGVAVVGGQSTAGKTFVEIHKSICLATATPYFEHKIIERVGTVFVAAEGRALLPNRFAATLMKLSIEARLPITWPKLLPDFSCTAGIKLFVRQLKAIDERYRGDFGVRLGNVPIDTVAATVGMKDEDDNAEATKVCNILRSIGDETGALMAPVHHYGKNPESGLRGASAWKGSADVIEGVLADIDPLTGRTSNRELVCTKARDGEQGPISPFDLEFIGLGLKDDGEIYGSCCVVPKAGQSRFEKGPAPTKGQRAIMAAIDEALDSCRKLITPRAGMPEVRAVKVSDVRAEFDRRYVVPDSDPAKASAAKRMAFKRALDADEIRRWFGRGCRLDLENNMNEQSISAAATKSIKVALRSVQPETKRMLKRALPKLNEVIERICPVIFAAGQHGVAVAYGPYLSGQQRSDNHRKRIARRGGLVRLAATIRTRQTSRNKDRTSQRLG